MGRERHHARDPVLDVARVGRRRARQQDPADPSDRRPPPALTHVLPAMFHGARKGLPGRLSYTLGVQGPARFP